MTFWLRQGPVLENCEKNVKIFFSIVVSIPTKMNTRNPNISKVLKKIFWALLVPLNDCFWHFWAKSQIFTWSRAQYFKNARWKCCSDWPKEHENAKKQGGGVESTPPSSTSLKYLRNERVDQRFHLLISKFVTFWSCSKRQSLHKKQWLWLNKTVKLHVF